MSCLAVRPSTNQPVCLAVPPQKDRNKRPKNGLLETCILVLLILLSSSSSSVRIRVHVFCPDSELSLPVFALGLQQDRVRILPGCVHVLWLLHPVRYKHTLWVLCKEFCGHSINFSCKHFVNLFHMHKSMT